MTSTKARTWRYGILGVAFLAGLTISLLAERIVTSLGKTSSLKRPGPLIHRSLRFTILQRGPNKHPSRRSYKAKRVRVRSQRDRALMIGRPRRTKF